MAVFTTPPTVVPGDTWTASNNNTYLKANMEAIFVGTTAGDLDYYSGSNSKTRLAAPADGSYVLGHTGTAPIWRQETHYIGVLLNSDAALTAGDNAARFRIPAGWNGFNIVSVAGSRQSGSGTVTIQIRNVTDAVDVCSTKLTITGTDSSNAVINTSNDDVANGDQFSVDVDGAGTSTLMCYIEIGLRRP